MDTELFELCKEVYEKTGWPVDNKTVFKSFENGQVYDGWITGFTPLYTSDYLLEKLPRNTWLKHSGLWVANCNIKHIAADTPLKALLKLVLALHDAGELK